ncbi:MAG: hypothetical protein WCW14_01305, partial [Candidatus Paceibacterota bacterium]
KSLRGKRAEDLIFNGGKDASRANRAGVKLVFDNTKRIFSTIDFDEVSIERAVHRDSSSEYSINGSQVRLRDVVELLANAHIGASGHHIISQGEADRILNANSREKREMIEDALGLKIFQYKKAESVRKLEKTRENIEKVESLRRELAPHLRFLKKQVEKVEKALEMKKELLRLYHIYFSSEEMYLTRERDSVVKAKEQPIERLTALDQQLEEAKSVLANSVKKDEKSDRLVKLERDLSEARRKREEGGRAVGRLEGEIMTLERVLVREREALSRIGEKTIPLSSVLEASQEISMIADKAEAENDINVLRGLVRSVKEIIVRFVSEHRTAEDTSRIREIEVDISRLNNEKRSIEANLEQIEKNESVLMVEVTDFKNEIEREKDSSRDAEKAIFKIMAEQNEVRATLGAIKVREDKLAIEEADFKREIGEAGAIIGINATHYQKVDLHDEKGLLISRENLILENRQVQEDRRRVMEKIKIRLEDAGMGGGSDEVLKEYQESSERDAFLARELEDLIKSSASLEQLITDLETQLTNQFKDGVGKINTQFQNFFALMFGGGTAGLAVTREKKRKRADTDELSTLASEMGEVEAPEEEEIEEGVEIEVNLPRKKVKSLMMLSGGERALTSIALLFAISQVNPPPFIILDETDAALDEANSRKYGDMIENLAKFSQLILITHNRETMSRAGVLYGVTMGNDGVSKLLSIQFEEAVAVAK